MDAVRTVERSMGGGVTLVHGNATAANRRAVRCVVDLSDVTSIDESGERLWRNHESSDGARFVARGVDMKHILRSSSKQDQAFASEIAGSPRPRSAIDPKETRRNNENEFPRNRIRYLDRGIAIAGHHYHAIRLFRHAHPPATSPQAPPPRSRGRARGAERYSDLPRMDRDARRHGQCRDQGAGDRISADSRTIPKVRLCRKGQLLFEIDPAPVPGRGRSGARATCAGQRPARAGESATGPVAGAACAGARRINAARNST